jgi:hypothetical protein
MVASGGSQVVSTGASRRLCGTAAAPAKAAAPGKAAAPARHAPAPARHAHAPARHADARHAHTAPGQPRWVRRAPRGTGIAFNLQKILPGGLIALVGGLLYVVVSFFPWYIIQLCYGLGVPCVTSTRNAWDRGPATFSVLLFLLVAVIFVVMALQVVAPKVPLEMIALGAVVLGDILFLVSLISLPPQLLVFLYRVVGGSGLPSCSASPSMPAPCCSSSRVASIRGCK